MKKGRWISFLISFALSLLMLFCFWLGWFERLEYISMDLRLEVRGNLIPNHDVVVISADEKSFADPDLGRWPWPRNVHAKLIDFLTKAGAKVIVFDVLFTEPDKDRPWADEELARAAIRSGRVVFGAHFEKDDMTFSPTKPLLPISVLRHKNVSLGSVNIWPETDGVTRRVVAWVDHDDKIFPSLSLAALAVVKKMPVEDLIQELDLPVENNSGWNEFYVNFARAEYVTEGFEVSYPYFSYTDVYKGRRSAELFRDKIVLVGGTATANYDFVSVPNNANFPGLLVHATALDNYLARSYFQRVNSFWTMLLILIFGLGCGLATVRVRAWVSAFVMIFWVIGYFVVCQIYFNNKYLLLDFASPAITLLFTYLSVLCHRFMTVEREKRWIKGTFSQYLSPKVIDVITADPAKLALGGQEREMSVFFSDLAGFTSISEALKPTDLVAVLNEYLTEMSEIILKYDGVVDKYIGDAIMAFWNAPVDQPRHAAMACFAALDQIKKLAELQKRFSERKLPMIDCRIGVNTGNMVVGNMGSKNRFDYTVMGDSVNLASRLEGANKPFHTHIMISEFTYKQVKDEVEVRQLDLLRVKGKAIPIRVYELVARKGELPPEKKKAFALYEDGLELYREKKFKKALEAFQKVREILPEDGPAEVYIQRSENYVESPPPKDWDGVFVMTTK